jgi:hypothetical protein
VSEELIAFRKPGGGTIPIWASEVETYGPAPVRGSQIDLKDGTRIRVDNTCRKVFDLLSATGWSFPANPSTPAPR